MTELTRLAVAASLALSVVACGDDGGGSSDTFGTLPPSSFELTDATRGLSATLTSPLNRLASQFADDANLADNLVVVDQLFSEPKHLEVANGVGEAIEPRFGERIGELYGNERLAGSLSLFETTYWVVDLQRLDRQWLVDWRGLERDVEGTRETEFTVAARAANNNGDYQAAVLSYIENGIANAPAVPDVIVIGSDLEQQYLAAPDDWPALVAMIRATATAIRAEHPEVRVSAGINWLGFYNDVVPDFIVPDVTEEFGAVRAAWEVVLDPLYVDIEVDEDGEEIGVTPFMDLYAFSAIPNTDVSEGGYALPEDVPDEAFVGITQRFDETPGREMQVAFVRVGWPTQSSSELWRRWLIRMTELVGGLDVPVMAWWGYDNYEEDFCAPRILAAGGRRFLCNRGFYSPSGARNDLYGAYFE